MAEQVLVLYDGKYSGQQIDAFLSRIEQTAGSGPLQTKLENVKAEELAYGQYITVRLVANSDGSNSIIFGVPRGKDGIDGKNGKSAYEYAREGGYTGSMDQFCQLLGNLNDLMVDIDAAQHAAEAAGQSERNAADSESAAAASQSASLESSKDSEAWAVGQRGGQDVSDADETYENNSKYWAGQAQSYAEQASVPPVEGVYNVILTDRVTSERYALLIENGHIKLLGVSDELEATEMRLVDNQTGAAYSLVVNNGRLGIEEVA